MNCQEYAFNRAQFDLGNCLDDEMVMMAADVNDMNDKVKELQQDRLQFVTIGLTKGGEPKIIFTDEEGFKQSVDEETKLKTNIALIKGKFVQFNQIFEELQTKLPTFQKPTLRQLKRFVTDAQNDCFNLDVRLKDELHFRLTSTNSRRMNIDDVINDPTFVEHKKNVDERIAKLKQEVEIAQKYIEIIDGVLRS